MVKYAVEFVDDVDAGDEEWSHVVITVTLLDGSSATRTESGIETLDNYHETRAREIAEELARGE